MANEPPSLPWDRIAGIVAILGTLVFLFAPLTSSRPGGDGNKAGTPFGHEDVDARLWQDPFEAVKFSRKANETAADKNDRAHTLEDLKSEFDEKDRPGTQPSILILPVMLPGGPYPEDAEWRLRMRHAILSGISVAKYIPEESTHIGYIEIPWVRQMIKKLPNKDVEAEDHTSPLLTSIHDLITDYASAKLDTNVTHITIPYEWCSPLPPDSTVKDNVKQSFPRRVLVLWLSDSDFGDNPVLRLRDLLGRLKENVTREVCVKVIGPASSDSLRALVNADVDPLPPARNNSDWPIEIYSPWATAPNQFLFENRAKSERILRAEKISIVRTVHTDDDVLFALVRELALRNRDLKGEPAKYFRHIVVVSEWDTIYARTLEQQFFRIYLDSTPPSPSGQKLNLSNISPSQWSSYLRGIDGKLPGAAGEQTGERSNDNSIASASAKYSVHPLEPPTGRNQLDYLRRLAVQLEDYNSQLKNMDDGVGIIAIGVLGTDVYDKLLVLQALRREFPGILFFTTDLDARLAYPAEANWSHNLVVASSFGYSLRTDLQQNIPPFRDSYQTAAFYTVLRALDPEQYRNEDIGSPRVFEISRGPIRCRPEPLDR